MNEEITPDDKPDDKLKDLVSRLNQKNPDQMTLMFNMEDPETRERLTEYVFSSHKDPKRIAAYETQMQGPYTKDQWHAERGFIEKCFRMVLFNKMLYHLPGGGGGGGHQSVRSIDDLTLIFERVETAFERHPTGTVEYGLD